MMRRVLFFGLAIGGLAGCGGDEGLTVSGYARLVGDDFRTGFEFATDVRIDGEGAAGGVTGSCQIQRLDEGEYGVVVDLFGGGGDEGLRSLTLTARTDGGSSSVEAQLASATYRAGATCSVDVTYVDESGSVTLDSRDCEVASSTDAATLDAHLELHGCSVTSD